jgi:hypothetical protein
MQGQEKALLKPEKDFTHQIQLRHDNDFLFGEDRYYTTGNFITLTVLLNNAKDSLVKRQHVFSLFQEIYTPTDLLEINYLRYDRPYASILGFQYQHSVAFKTVLYQVGFSAGITGDSSGGNWLQNAFHSSVSGSRASQWIAQITEGLIINSYGSFTKEWHMSEAPLGIYLALSPSVALGTKDVYLQNDFVMYFGKKQPAYNSIAYNQIGSLKKEFFVAVRIGYRYVFHDTMLQGNLLGDSSLYTVNPTPNIFIYNIENYFRYKRYDVKLFLNFISKRTPKAQEHLYFVFSIAKQF